MEAYDHGCTKVYYYSELMVVLFQKKGSVTVLYYRHRINSGGEDEDGEFKMEANTLYIYLIIK